MVIPTEWFFWFVTLIAIIYTVAVRFIQRKFVDKDKQKGINKKLSENTKKYTEAMKKDNKREVERLQKEQGIIMKEFQGVMFSQFKIMGIVLVFFFGFMWIVNSVDPTVADDQSIIFNDDGLECDETAGDNRFTACFNIQDGNPGPWVVHATAFKDGANLGENATFFYFKEVLPQELYLQKKGNEPSITTNKNLYEENEQVIITVVPPGDATRVEGTVNKGTWFYVDLPFTIPFLNIQRIHQAYWWFIFLSIVFGITVSVLMGIVEKSIGKKGDKNAETKR
ncbi:DUF106 domain-containing protein [Candidatus Micrarchaeota archaeon]|nr:DUF106 domain-containing protein [Candidatus Micrarchaeota archaeon]